jgi:inosine-uridine nucleoside N-ribohydrolase
MRILWRALLVFAVTAGLLAPAAGPAAAVDETGRPIPVIYDSDLDIDDAATLAFLCEEHKQRRVDLRAVTVTDNGFGLPGRTRQHALSVLEQCGLPGIPVAEGMNETPHKAPADARRDVEKVLSGALGDAGRDPGPATVTAAQLIATTLATTPGKITVLATGPLTNLARAVPAGSRQASKVGALHVMGGAVEVGGNLFGEALPGFDNSQELNIWLDPAGARDIFAALPAETVHLTPLDATNHVPITPAYVDRLGADMTTPSARIVHAIMTQPVMEAGIPLGFYYWWDAVAALRAFHNDGVVTDVRTTGITVVQDGPQSGRTAASADGNRLRVAYDADPVRFEQVFLDGLNGR